VPIAPGVPRDGLARHCGAPLPAGRLQFGEPAARQAPTQHHIECAQAGRQRRLIARPLPFHHRVEGVAEGIEGGGSGGGRHVRSSEEGHGTLPNKHRRSSKATVAGELSRRCLVSGLGRLSAPHEPAQKRAQIDSRFYRCRLCHAP
jgi:hypothetical protein